ncbi:hypothetical protein FB451DRAFT_1172472 [Mycena latifolia]|nr:hypothetical protein FB451DRAFT_1172472 [Mycena latifolia]
MTLLPCLHGPLPRVRCTVRPPRRGWKPPRTAEIARGVACRIAGGASTSAARGSAAGPRRRQPHPCLSVLGLLLLLVVLSCRGKERAVEMIFASPPAEGPRPQLRVLRMLNHKEGGNCVRKEWTLVAQDPSLPRAFDACKRSRCAKCYPCQPARAHLGTARRSAHGAGYDECNAVCFAHYLFLGHPSSTISVNSPRTPASFPVCPPMERDAPNVPLFLRAHGPREPNKSCTGHEKNAILSSPGARFPISLRYRIRGGVDHMRDADRVEGNVNRNKSNEISEFEEPSARHIDRRLTFVDVVEAKSARASKAHTNFDEVSNQRVNLRESRAANVRVDSLLSPIYLCAGGRRSRNIPAISEKEIENHLDRLIKRLMLDVTSQGAAGSFD